MPRYTTDLAAWQPRVSGFQAAPCDPAAASTTLANRQTSASTFFPDESRKYPTNVLQPCGSGLFAIGART